MLVKYGVENASQNQDILLKKKNTHLTNKGTEYPFQLEIVKRKIKATIIRNFGVENISQSDYAKEKKRQTTLLNYGVESPMQNSLLFHKQLVNSYNRKIYIPPSGILRYVQCYEHFALDELFKIYKESDILTNRFDVPRILYDKTHYYYPDIYIVSENKIIEVKSSYTYEKCKNINEMKRDACISLGYSFEFWIFDNKRNKTVLKELESMHISMRLTDE